MSALRDLATEFVGQFEKGEYNAAIDLLSRIKRELAANGLIVPSPNARQEDLVATRKLLEIGVLAAIHARNDEEINRLVAQIRPFYAKKLNLPPSEDETKILGLYLLLLVANNEIAEFHSELETLDNPEADQHLAYPIRLERWLMEGSYDKVWQSITQESEFPSPEYAILAESLVATVRTEIALCSERAYASLPVANARHLLFFRTDQEIIEFASQRENWTVKNGRIYFPQTAAEDVEHEDSLPHLGAVPAESVIAHSLNYAQKIETII